MCSPLGFQGAGGAGGNTANYKSDVLELTGKRNGKTRPWITKLLNEGHDPPKIIVKEAKRRGIDVYYSFRFNDIHDSFMPDEMATFKVEHPEWMIGEQLYGNVKSFRSSLDFSVPEVRELKFQVVKELFEKYDFDGIEIDFLRGTPYFFPGKESENAHLLTELLARIRKHLDKRGNERGRPIQLAVRVDESLQACKLDGFEVGKWVKQGLIDHLILGSGVIDINVGEFKQLSGPKKVPVYPCLYGWPSKYYPIPEALATGIALNYWQQGADGIYLFNWFPHTDNNSEATGPYMAGLLKQIGDPKLLLANRRELMFVADRGRPQRAYQYNWMNCVLPEALPTDDALAVSFRVGADLTKQPAGLTATLQMAVDNLQPDDVVEVSLNNKPVKGLKLSKAGLLIASLSPKQLSAGENQATLKLARQSSKSDKPRTVTALEVHVKNPVLQKQTAKLVEKHELKKGNAQQGLALTKDAYYTSTHLALYRFDTKWNLLGQKRIQIPLVNHLGAIHHHDGFIWVGLLNGPKGERRSVVAKIRASDFEVVKTWDITKDVTWIDPVCFDGRYLWVGDLSDLGIHRYKFEGEKIVRDGIFRYPKAMHFSQGIRVRGNKLYTIHTFGSMDGLYEFDIPEQLTDAVNQPTQVWNIQETRMHLEGFDFIPGTPNQIWHAQGKGVDRYVLDGIENKVKVKR